jgi:hypothetical protein
MSNILRNISLNSFIIDFKNFIIKMPNSVCSDDTTSSFTNEPEIEKLVNPIKSALISIFSDKTVTDVLDKLTKPVSVQNCTINIYTT